MWNGGTTINSCIIFIIMKPKRILYYIGINKKISHYYHKIFNTYRLIDDCIIEKVSNIKFRWLTNKQFDDYKNNWPRISVT